ncbi:hypothetical protein EST38_g2221 [Candolleomyces aberdarensis]|uniref:Transcription factor Iwr1 domain-containing protein n=1 Tax=Candolleomyces aberdarensis TaxID=2316362 RepID=A0A4Q2DV48_9AGAR|nr:hypothetical protein EST38_g2221 [Candolleomyces aberdarensis]
MVGNSNRRVTKPLDVKKHDQDGQAAKPGVAFETAIYTATRIPKATAPRAKATTSITAPLNIRKKQVRFSFEEPGCSASSSCSSFLHPSTPPEFHSATVAPLSITSRHTDFTIAKTTTAYRYENYKKKAQAKSLRVLVLPVSLNFDIVSDADECSSYDAQKSSNGYAALYLDTDEDDQPYDDDSDVCSETSADLEIEVNGPGLSAEVLKRIVAWVDTVECEKPDEVPESAVEDGPSESDSNYDDYEGDMSNEFLQADEDDDEHGFYELEYEHGNQDQGMYYLSDEYAYQESLFSELSGGLA